MERVQRVVRRLVIASRCCIGPNQSTNGRQFASTHGSKPLVGCCCVNASWLHSSPTATGASDLHQSTSGFAWTPATRGFTTRAGSNNGWKARPSQGHNVVVRNDPEELFEQARSHLMPRKVPLLDHQLLQRAMDVNLRLHEFPRRGLKNAMEIATLATTKHASTFVLAPKHWSSVLLRMIELGSPVESMVRWMHHMQVEDPSREIIYVVAKTLDQFKRVDIALSLLQRYAKSKSAKTNKTSRTTTLNYLVRPFLNAKPSIQQVEAYVRVMQSSHTPADKSESSKIVCYYLDPLHHEPDRTPMDIARDFLVFHHQHREVLSWISNLSLSSTIDENLESKSLELAQQMQHLLTMDSQEREIYRSAVYGALREPEKLYEIATKRSTSRSPAPLDYDVCAHAIFASAHKSQDPVHGLAKGIELANTMAARPGFMLPSKTWHYFLLKMIKTKYPVTEMTRWIDTQQVENLPAAMLYVLPKALKEFEIVLSLLEHCLQKEMQFMDRNEWRFVLQGVQDAFVKANLTTDQLEKLEELLKAIQ